jgi:Ni/Fe-hydrogenase subunit HybB-like protein
MNANEATPEAEPQPSPAAYGDYGPVQVEMHDTLGVIALGIVSVLLLVVLLREQARSRALTERLMVQLDR